MKRFLMLASTGLFAASLAVLPMSAFAQGAAVGTDTKAPVPTVQPVITPVQAPAVKAAAPTTAPTTAAVSAPGIKTPAPIATTTRAMPHAAVAKPVAKPVSAHVPTAPKATGIVTPKAADPSKS